MITACNIKYQKKDGSYLMSLKHKDDDWEGEQSGAKIYTVGNYLVQTSWGAGKPIAVFINENDMLLNMEKIYKVKPTLEYI